MKNPNLTRMIKTPMPANECSVCLGSGPRISGFLGFGLGFTLVTILGAFRAKVSVCSYCGGDKLHT